MAAWRNLALVQDQRKTILLNTGNYRLLTNREYLDGGVWKSQNEATTSCNTKIRRWRFGESNPELINKTILIVGQTGTGKTTLINTMVNHMLDVKFEDKVWFEITDEGKQNQAESQTTAITVYEVHIDDSPNSLTIIDTPGYGDTRGARHDKNIPDLLHKLFKSYESVDKLDAVGLVMKASQNRLTDEQRYVFDAVLSIFGKDVEKNIVVLITYSDGMTPSDALNAFKETQTPCATDENGGPVYFTFNNRQCQQCDEKQIYAYQLAWQMGHNSLNEFFSFLSKSQGKNLRMTAEVLQRRMTLEACLINLQHRIMMEENIQSELKQIEEALKANKDKLDNNENFEFEIEETYKKEVPIKDDFNDSKELATRCTKCKENCHFPGCTWVSKDKLHRCEVMGASENGEYACKVCTNKCLTTSHVKDGNYYKVFTRKVKKKSIDLEKQVQDEYGKNVSVKDGIKQKLAVSKKEENRLVCEAYECIIHLQKIALKKAAMSIVVHLDFLIKKLKETGEAEKAEKLNEIQKNAQPPNPEIVAFYKTLFGLTER